MIYRRLLKILEACNKDDPVDFGFLINKIEEENQILRKFLWLNHGCESHFLYGDDGEMQCNCCMIDFKRDSIRKITRIIDYKKMKSMYGDEAAKAFFQNISQ